MEHESARQVGPLPYSVHNDHSPHTCSPSRPEIETSPALPNASRPDSEGDRYCNDYFSELIASSDTNRSRTSHDSDREEYFFQPNRVESDFDLGSSIGQRGRLSLGEGSMVVASAKDGQAILKRTPSETKKWLRDIWRGKRTTKHSTNFEEDIKLEHQVSSKSSRNLRDLLKPDAEGISDSASPVCRRHKQAECRDTAQWGSSKSLFGRVFKKRGSTRSGESTEEETEESGDPLEAAIEPISTDMPVEPRQVPRASTPVRIETPNRQSGRRSLILKNIKDATERRLPFGRRRPTDHNAAIFGQVRRSMTVPGLDQPVRFRRKSLLSFSLKKETDKSSVYTQTSGKESVESVDVAVQAGQMFGNGLDLRSRSVPGAEMLVHLEDIRFEAVDDKTSGAISELDKEETNYLLVLLGEKLLKLDPEIKMRIAVDLMKLQTNSLN